MLNAFQKFLKLVLIFSSVITGWTMIILLSNTTFKTEIKDLIFKMYVNQKNFIYNVKDLSILLVKDSKQHFLERNQDIIQLNNFTRTD